jgi:hypothetical protein
METQGGVRTPFTGRNFARKAERRSRDRGSRVKAVLATGSYEGSLTMEGIPGSHEPSFFTVRWSRRSWRLLHCPVHAQPPLSPTRRGEDRVTRAPAKAGEHGQEEGEATGMSEARSNRHRGKTTPTLAIPLRQRKEREALRLGVSDLGPPKRIGRCETPGPPVKPRGSQSPRGAHASKRSGVHRERSRCGCTLVYVRVAEVDQTHFASCPSSGRKARWWNQQGASQKEARSTA